MSFLEMIKPALLGAVVGAVVALAVGFGMEILVTASSARDHATAAAALAVADVMTPYCVAVAYADPAFDGLFAEMQSKGAYQRAQIVSRAGWATPLGAKAPHSGLADACQVKLMESA